MSKQVKTVFITGASRGFGKVWTEALLNQGYKVAATARNTETLNELTEKYGNAILPIQLDVTNREDSFAAISKAHEYFGSIDVLINNAGYALFGAIEEANEKEVRSQMNTNFFGTLWLTQAVLPIMRKQKSGHIIQVSSILGLVTLPLLGLYNASKFAIEGLSETLSTEVQEFGINITLVEPNGYATNLWNTGINTAPIDAYNSIKKATSENGASNSFGKIEATAEAILKLVAMEKPPLRLFLGKVALPFVKQVYEQRITAWEAFNDISEAAHG